MDPRETIDAVASLARLDLGPEERGPLAAQLQDILGHFESIRTLPTGGIAPLVHATGGAGVTRADEPVESLPREELLANAPETADGFLGVPKVVEA